MLKNTPADKALVEKYNLPVPRYTSYPTVPFWDDQVSLKSWEQMVTRQFEAQNKTRGISLYIHLPFCESLCTYCGCNKKITTNHSVEDVYISAIEKEWKLYRQLMNDKPVIRELHLGGGTPTFFSPANLDKLLNIILSDSLIHPLHEFSVEGHPNNTTPEHLETLYRHGFRRISYGVQDNDPQVQRVINRIQPFENVKRATEAARKAGFTSVNFDLIYGLPLQTLGSIERTMNQVLQLRPDRLAFYSYAHVPWTSRGQRLFDESHLPKGEEKMSLYLRGRELLTAAGYADIGMDHFALPTDELYKARMEHLLHRNFMGYTTQHSGMLLALGVSGISDIGTGYAQNEKSLHDYYAALDAGRLPVRKGYFLSDIDLLFKNTIIDIACKGVTIFEKEQLELLRKYSFPILKKLAADNLVEFNEMTCRVTHKGRFFTRNICSAFDICLQAGKQQQKMVFSQAI